MVETRTLPWSWYVDPGVLDTERSRLFATAWQYVGHTGMKAPGAYFPTRLGTTPIVVTCDADGVVRGLVNVCRHRGAIVCERPGKGSLQCPYHAWTYELDGALRSAPRSAREPHFDPTDHRLAEVAVSRWGPFLFAAMDPHVAFDEWIGDIPARVAEAMDVDDLRFLHRWEHTYRANWKICVENFLECYHCRLAHPGFSRVIATGPDDYRLIPHTHGSSQYGPVRRTVVSGFDPSGPVTRGQFHVRYPNTAINVLPGRPNLSIGPVTPLAPGETHRYLDYFVGPNVDAEWIATMLAFDEEVGAEDVALVESVQRGMESRALDHGTLFVDSELLIAHFASYIRSHLG